jgi:hypothetical protein
MNCHSLSLRTALSLSIFLFLFEANTPRAIAPSPSSQPAPSTSTTPASDDATAKAAAERKKRFEAEKNRLEAADPKPQSLASDDPEADCQASANDLSLSPALVNMLVGQTQRFSLFDLGGHKLTSQAEWSVSDTSIADIAIEGGVPVLTSKQTGTLHVRARIDARSTESTVNDINPEDMKPGPLRWSVRRPESTCLASQPVFSSGNFI